MNLVIGVPFKALERLGHQTLLIILNYLLFLHLFMHFLPQSIKNSPERMFLYHLSKMRVRDIPLLVQKVHLGAPLPQVLLGQQGLTFLFYEVGNIPVRLFPVTVLG